MMKLLLRSGNMRISVPLLLLLVCACVTGNAETLKSPWDNKAITLTDASFRCPDPPPFAKSLNAEAYYIDAHHSVIDPVKHEAYVKASEPPTHFGTWAGDAADAYLTTGSRAAAQCVYTLLSAAAAAEAWTAAMPTGQSTYVQKWTLAATSMAYLKVRKSGVGTAAQDKSIQQWLGVLAGRIHDYVESKRPNPNSDAWNNHLYWAGFAIAASGVARNNPRDFQFGMQAYKTGVSAIGPDGTLPREMARAGMALHYHLYALAPLIMLAELGEANGLHLYAENNHAIDRLAALCREGLLHPEIFAKPTGVEQKVPDKISGQDIGWAVPYVKRHPDPQLSAWIAQAPTTRFWQWGGLPPE